MSIVHRGWVATKQAPWSRTTIAIKRALKTIWSRRQSSTVVQVSLTARKATFISTTTRSLRKSSKPCRARGFAVRRRRLAILPRLHKVRLIRDAIGRNKLVLRPRSSVRVCIKLIIIVSVGHYPTGPKVSARFGPFHRTMRSIPNELCTRGTLAPVARFKAVTGTY